VRVAQQVPIRCYTVSRPEPDLEEIGRFLADEGFTWHRTASKPADELVELAGRICYMSFGERQSPRDNVAYVRNLIVQGHESVLEHACWTFLIVGVTRAFTHQLVRHRVGFSFSQLSQQYYDHSDIAYIEPSPVRRVPEAHAAWLEAIEAVKSAYAKILRLYGEDTKAWPRKELLRELRSIARSILPNAAETKIVVSANARAWRHFLEVRGSILGDEEMRRVCAEILCRLQVDSRSLFDDFVIETLADGSPSVVRTATTSRKNNQTAAE
jgi:thymidylate synthase (FAD)